MKVGIISGLLICGFCIVQGLLAGMHWIPTVIIAVIVGGLSGLMIAAGVDIKE